MNPTSTALWEALAMTQDVSRNGACQMFYGGNITYTGADDVSPGASVKAITGSLLVVLGAAAFA